MSSRSQPSVIVDSAVGINDGAYFVGRKEIIEYLNNQLDLSLEKIEQTASGAVACQLMDKFFPGSVQMKRVNWEAKSDFQFIENYKILQAAFTTCNIQKHIDVDRLIRAKYQDNLEFCQWLKAFFEQVSSNASAHNSDHYEPLARRMLGKGGTRLEPHFMPLKLSRRPHTTSGVAIQMNEIQSVGRPSLGNITAVGISSRRSSIATTATSGTVSSSAAPTLKRTLSKPPIPVVGINNSSTPLHNSENTIHGHNKNKRIALMKENSPGTGKDAFTVDLDIKVNDLLERNAELQLQLESVENERSFYFEKLRGIELMLQLYEEADGHDNPYKLISDISRVLCSKVEDNVVVNDEGIVLPVCFPLLIFVSMEFFSLIDLTR
jgi:RP/EB family microtubule-associated protein